MYISLDDFNLNAIFNPTLCVLQFSSIYAYKIYILKSPFE